MRIGNLAIGLIITLVLGSGLSAQSSGSNSHLGGKENPKRPNILFAFADDWGKYASVYADIEGSDPWQSLVKTPNIDRVAKEGALFNNAFVNAPSCTPSRSAILSGQYFYRTGRGAILQGALWDTSIPTYPLLLEESGYHIGYTYKVWSPGTPVNAGYGGNRTKYQTAGSNFNAFSQRATEHIKSGLSVEQAKSMLYKEVEENFQSFLDANQEGAPFCYWFGPTNTHRKWTVGSGKDLWAIDPDKLKGNMPAFLPDVPMVRQDFADYMGEVMAFDGGLGILLKMLEKWGELENTIIVVSGDHGIPGFTNGKCNLYDFGTNVALAVRYPQLIPANRVLDDFVNLMDLAPTFLDIGNVEIPEGMTGKSLMPILKSSGNGRVDSSRSFVITGRERHVAKAREGNLPYPQRAYRTKDYLYILNFEPDRWPMGNPNTITDSTEVDFNLLANNTFVGFADLDASPTKAWIVQHREEVENHYYFDMAFGKRPREELYQVSTDPYQVKNLAYNPKYVSVRKEMNLKLLSELERTKDPRVLGDGQTFEKPPYAGPFDK
jgi:arylsulfatase A-like enzyme